MSVPPSQNSWSQVPLPPRPVAPPPPTEPPPDRAKNNRVVGILLGSCGALLVALVVLYFVVQNAPAKIVTPVRAPVPKQNDFDALKAAAEKAVKQKEVAKAMGRTTKSGVPPPQKQALVRDNDAAIKAATAALTLPYLETNTSTMSSTFPHYPKFRALTRTFLLAGDVAWEENKPGVAASHYLSGVTIGRRVPHNTVVLGRLVGVACETIGRAGVWSHIDRMDADTAAQCLTRLNALQSETLPFVATLEEDKWTIAQTIVELYKNPGKPIAPDEADTDDEKQANAVRAYIKIVPQAVAVDTANKHMDKLIARSRQPFPQSKGDPKPPKEALTYMLTPPVFRIRLKFVANETGDNLLRTALALRVHRLRSGKHPANLSELVAAKLLPAVPDDPFALPGELLKYKPLPTGKYLLYSIGPDSVDDKGKGIQTVKAGKTVRFVEAESKGDVVAGWYSY